MFTVARIKALCPGADPAILEAAVPIFDGLDNAYDVTSTLRAAHFIAQLAHESAGFTAVVENLNYSAERIPKVWPRLAPRAAELAHKPQALANAAYAGRLGNGPEASGDGWRHRGRGLMQITGRSNYEARGKAIGLDLVAFPDKAADPALSALLAFGYWSATGCNAAADADDVAKVTKLINGPAMLGLEERKRLTQRAKAIFV